MLTELRSFAERARRRDRAAVVIAIVCGSFGLAMALPGGRAFMDEPCPTFFRPIVEETTRARMVIVCGAVAQRRLAPRPPVPPPPRIVQAERVWRPAPGPVAPRPRVRGPPTLA